MWTAIPKLVDDGKAPANDLKSPEICVLGSGSLILEVPFWESWSEFLCDPDVIESLLAKLVWLKSMSSKSSLERDLLEKQDIG